MENIINFNIKQTIENNTILYFRAILFLTFFGHGLVSLGFSHGYELHYRIFQSVNIFHWNIETCLIVLGWWDIFLALGIISGIFPRFFLSLALTYLACVALAGYLYYHSKTGSLFGFAESFRRFAWIFYAIFLWLFYFFGIRKYSLLRIGIGFAFLAHGLASLGFFGLKGAHIELASQVLSEELANKMVYYSGYSDTLLGGLLISGFLSRPAAIIGTLWLVFVVYLSYLVGFPEAIFRSGFLFSCLYVALDKRCH
jgi:uncharacterized membrane protein YphA (DoxX/SURF4 family)